MSIRLWHATWPGNVDPIMMDGFIDGDMGWVYLSPAGDPNWRDGGKAILEVALNASESELAPFSETCAYDERWDEQAHAYVKVTDPALIYYQTILRFRFRTF